MNLAHHMVLLAFAGTLSGCAVAPESQPIEAPPPLAANMPAAAPSAISSNERAADPEEGSSSKEKVVVMGTEPPTNRVCRNEARTGSRLRTRRCYSQKELQEMSREAREWIKTGGERGAVSRVRQTTVSAPETP